MIFNPYNLSQLTEEAIESDLGNLSWAQPLLQDNVLIVCLVLVFFIIDILACCRKGVLQHQLMWIADTRNSRTFESSLIIYPWIMPLLIIQVFLFFGLSLFCIFDNNPAMHLQSFGSVTWPLLIGCIGALLGWYLLQKFLYNWFCYLFKQKEKQTIMNRTYQAVWMILAPFAMLIFILLFSGAITMQTSLFLLAALFILSQIGFIFIGFKIFFEGIGSLFLIIVYLCTLEIAPILVILGKITSQQL